MKKNINFSIGNNINPNIDINMEQNMNINMDNNLVLNNTSNNNNLLNKNKAIEIVITNAMVAGLVARGISEVIKSIETQKVQLIFLAENIDNDQYKQTVLNLAKQMNIPIIFVDLWENLKDYCKLGIPCAKLREIALAKGKPVKIKPKCSSCAIIDYGMESEEKKYLEQFFCYLK